MINNKQIKIILSIVIFVTIILTAVYVKNNRLTNDERKFKYEYEKFNGKKNLSKIKYVNVNIVDENNVNYLTNKELIKFINSKTGIVFFGYPESNFSRNAIEVLLDVVKNTEYNSINYYNLYQDRDEKFLDEAGEVYTLKKSSDLYNKVLEYLGNKADTYNGLNNDKIKRVYFPTVLFIKDGKLKSIYSGTFETNIDGKKLTKHEKLKLKKIYKKGINKINE